MARKICWISFPFFTTWDECCIMYFLLFIYAYIKKRAQIVNSLLDNFVSWTHLSNWNPSQEIENLSPSYRSPLSFPTINHKGNSIDNFICFFHLHKWSLTVHTFKFSLFLSRAYLSGPCIISNDEKSFILIVIDNWV